MTFGVTVSGTAPVWCGSSPPSCLQAAIVYGTIADLNGRRAAFGECLSSGLRNWFWLLLLAIGSWRSRRVRLHAADRPRRACMAVAWIVAAPAQVVERTGVFGAFSRSAELTRGHRWPIFGLLVIYLHRLRRHPLVSGVVAVVATGVAIGLRATPPAVLAIQ